MNKTIFLFPGQGSQAVGMGLDVFNQNKKAKKVFEEVDDTLKQNLSKIIFEGSEEELSLTENTQPALMATSIAYLKVLEEKLEKPIEQLCQFVAGHSLGEYTALCAVEAISLKDTAKLLKARGKAMQMAVTKGKGGMAALIGEDYGQIKKLVDEIASSNLVCEIANDNGGGQVVISGEIKAIERAEEIYKNFNIKRFVRLNVSAPFHSSLIKKAADVMALELSKVVIHKPKLPVIANITATINSDEKKIKDLLVAQVCGTVRWRESMEGLKGLGITKAYEIGSGKVLAGLLKRIDKEIEVVNINSLETINNLAS